MNTAVFLARIISYRPWLYVADDAIWIAIYASGLLPGLVAQRAFDALQGGAADVPAILWFAALFVGVGITEAVLNVLGWAVDVHFRFNLSALLQRNMLAEILRRPGANALDRTPGAALSVLRDDVEHAENSAEDDRHDRSDPLLPHRDGHPRQRQCEHRALRVRPARRDRRGRAGRHDAAPPVAPRGQQATSAVTGALAETFGAVQAVQLARAETAVVEHLRGLSETRRRALLRERRSVLFAESLYSNTVSIGTGLILLLGARAMREGTFTVGDFALFVSYLGIVTQFTNFAGRFLTTYKQLDVSVARMLALMRGAQGAAVPSTALVEHAPLHLRTSLPAAATLQRPPAAAGQLRLLEARGITYRHPGANSAAGVEDVTLRIARGTFTVITGRIGAGKTTLLRVILGLLPRDRGEIVWNGIVAEPATLLVPPTCAYVPQVPRLFSDTVRQNILLGLPAESVAIDEAVSAAALDRDVAQLEDRLETRVGSRGVRLSGGQVQRVAAARALVRDPELLVVDDLSSALDVDTEALLWDRLLAARAGRTILAVSHRRPVLRRAHRIIIMRDGAVDDEGSLQELLERSMEMRRLWADEAAAQA